MEGDFGTQTEKNRSETFQSTPSAWRETESNHVLHERFDFNPLPPHGGRQSDSRRTSAILYFNPLPPHGGRRFGFCVFPGNQKFQSTPSAWRETSCWNIMHGLSAAFQSTPSAWRETTASMNAFCHSIISIHSLRMEGDPKKINDYVIIDISIHSLRMEGDIPQDREAAHGGHFNPLPPHGGRPLPVPRKTQLLHFNPLPPHGGRRSEKD